MSNELRGEHRPPFSSFRLSHPSFLCLWTRSFEIIRKRVKRGGVFFVLPPCMVLLFLPHFTYGHHKSIPPFSSPFLPFSYQNHCCRTGLRRGWDGPGEREREKHEEAMNALPKSIAIFAVQKKARTTVRTCVRAYAFAPIPVGRVRVDALWERQYQIPLPAEEPKTRPRNDFDIAEL